MCCDSYRAYNMTYTYNTIVPIYQYRYNSVIDISHVIYTLRITANAHSHIVKNLMVLSLA